MSTVFLTAGLAGIFLAAIVWITGGSGGASAFGIQIPHVKDPKKARLLEVALSVMGVVCVALAFAPVGKVALQAAGHQSNYSTANDRGKAAQPSAVSPSPAVDSPTQITSSPTSPASPSPRPNPILSPLNEPGFTLVEQGTFTIGSAGIDFRTSGWADGTGAGNADPNGSDDLLYDGAGSWSNSDTLVYWSSGVAPTPGACNGWASAQNSITVTGMPKVGDKYCAAPSSGGLIAYMQVTAIDNRGVHVEAWLWSQNG